MGVVGRHLKKDAGKENKNNEDMSKALDSTPCVDQSAVDSPGGMHFIFSTAKYMDMKAEDTQIAVIAMMIQQY